MKIVEDYNEGYQVSTLKVTSATYQGGFKIKVTFSDGSSNTVDFGDFLTRSIHPSITKYNDEKKFKQFQIVGGNLNWNDYDMIFPISDLQSGKI